MFISEAYHHISRLDFAYVIVGLYFSIATYENMKQYFVNVVKYYYNCADVTRAKFV